MRRIRIIDGLLLLSLAAPFAAEARLNHWSCTGPVDLDTTMQATAKGRPETLIVVPSRLTAFLSSKRIVDVAMQQRIPVISGCASLHSTGP